MSKRIKPMSRKARDELTRGFAIRYAMASKKEKGLILDQAVQATGFNRKYLISKISSMTYKAPSYDFFGNRVKKAHLKAPPSCGRKKGRPVKYDEAFRLTLVMIWQTFDCMSPKRLLILIKDNITQLMGYGRYQITEEIKNKLLQISPSAADRILKEEREKQRVKGRCGTRSPGSNLNSMIPLRACYTKEERNESGHFEIDTVAHCGYGDLKNCLWTLTLTDVCTGYVYIRPLLAKTQRYVLQALDSILDNALYPIRELHMDNGSEFKNYGFLFWCDKNNIAYSRSRSYHKNDNCFVEGKNFSIVRSNVGYCRYLGQTAYDLMEELYWYLERLANYFYPSVKLMAKERMGNKTVKTYDIPRTPYERLMMDESVSQKYKDEIKADRAFFSVLDMQLMMQDLREKLTSKAVKESRFERIGIASEEE